MITERQRGIRYSRVSGTDAYTQKASPSVYPSQLDDKSTGTSAITRGRDDVQIKLIGICINTADRN